MIILRSARPERFCRKLKSNMLFHVSEESEILRFEPRISNNAQSPVVWAVDDARLRNYLLPRDCPRVTYYVGEKTTSADRERFLGSSDMSRASASVVAVEAGWLDRIRTTRLYCYALPSDHFECVDETAGYFHSRVAVTPTRVDLVEDLLGALVSRGVEIRILPTLWPLHDAVIGSTLRYSIIRMRNAMAR